MRTQGLTRAIAPLAILGLVITCTACAGPMGEVAGTVVGGAGWAAMKTGKAAFKGGKFAARATGNGVKVAGRTVKGAANGVHEEFHPPVSDPGQDTDQIGQLSQAERATLPY